MPPTKFQLKLTYGLGEDVVVILDIGTEPF